MFDCPDNSEALERWRDREIKEVEKREKREK